ncbi:hypothetical protein QBC44DRAFT_335308 [Cladorrhinum sp. PSN332]|nr:hypothetical protein QBC44DRAFT_335308 [Cladorrhinum sp. PSN332]
MPPQAGPATGQKKKRRPSGAVKAQNSAGNFHQAPPRNYSPAPAGHYPTHNNHSHTQLPTPRPPPPPVTYSPLGKSHTPHGNHSGHVEQWSPPKQRNRSKCFCDWPWNWSCFLPLISCLVFVIAIALGCYATAGCTSTNATLPSMYLAELRTNSSGYETKLGIGYFGGCLTFDSSLPSNNTAPGSGDQRQSQTVCLKNIRSEDLGHLTESFSRRFSNDVETAVNHTIPVMLPTAKYIQEDIFHAAVPISHLVLLSVSAFFLYGGLMVSSKRKVHTTALLIGAAMGAFSIGLVLVMAVGLHQAMNGVMGDADVDVLHKAEGVYLYRAGSLRWVFWAGVSMTAIFYGLVGWMYVKRSAVGKNPIGDFMSKWVTGHR